MKRTTKFLAGLVFPCALLLNGCGYGADAAPAASIDAPPPPAVQADLEPEDFTATGYVLGRDVSVRVIEEGREQAIDLQMGQEIAVIEQREDENLGTLVRVGIDAEEGAAMPADIWVRESDLRAGDLIPYAPGDEVEAEGMSEQEFEILKKMTYCYRYVKMYLLKTGKVKSYLPGVSAYMAAKTLPKHGFRRTGNRPATAKNGEVCVYAGGPKGHGHIEIKRNGKWWYGYGFKARPIANRRFIACFVK
jgi:hypothetical protein